MTDGRSTSAIDLGNLLDSSPWSRYQKWILAFSAVAFAVDGLANQVLGVAIPALVEAWGVPKTEFATVAALGLAGVAIGTAGGGFLGDKIGRRWGLIASMTLFGLATVGTAFVSDVHSLMVLRFFDGLGIGGAIPSGAALISEFTPHRRRSRAIAIGMVFIPVGGFLAGSLGSLILPNLGWRAYFFTAGILPLLGAVLFLFALPESPRFLRHKPERKPELLALLGRFGHGFGPDTQFVDRADEEQTDRAPLKALLGPKVIRDTLGIWGAFFFCLMASYTIFSWVPTMLAGLHFDAVVASVAISAFHVGGMIGGVICGFLIEKVGSRVSLTALTLGSIVVAVALQVVVSLDAPAALLVITTMVVEGVCISGIHNVVYTLAAHAYPPFIRATGVGAASTVGRFGAILSSYTGVLALEIGGANAYFASIAILLALCLLVGLVVRNHVPPAEVSTDKRKPSAQPVKQAG